jgi:DNA-binding transcriptional ArsR family regulator
MSVLPLVGVEIGSDIQPGEGMAQALTERYGEHIAGVLSCYDRILITGTLPTVCFAGGMTSFLYRNNIPIFDYTKFAEPLRERVREKAHAIAFSAGITIQHIAKSHIRKEEVVAEVLAKRGTHPGLVHVISAMEGCDTYKPRLDKKAGKLFLRPDRGQCLHYYFYFIDKELGLVHLRVPTWCPFRLQFYCNGHSWLARQLDAADIDYTLADNAFTRIDDFPRAQQLADNLSPDRLHRILDRYARQCCPVLDTFAERYHWSLTQVEYSTDIVFRSPGILKALYEQLCRQAVLTVKAENIATFLSHKLPPHVVAEIGSGYSTRIEGTCIKHRYGKCSVKMYDKFSRVLRLETTTNDVSFFKHHRKVEHRDKPSTFERAPVKKSIYSLKAMRDILLACNQRYLAYLSTLDDFSAGVRALDKVTRPRSAKGKSVKPINFFSPIDQSLLRALFRPGFNIAGVRRSDLVSLVAELSPSALSRHLARLRHLGIIRRIRGSYRYSLTTIGRAVITAGSYLTENVLIPALA